MTYVYVYSMKKMYSTHVLLHSSINAVSPTETLSSTFALVCEKAEVCLQ